MSSVLGKVSGHRGSRGWFSGSVKRRAVKTSCIQSSRRSAGGSPSSASNAPIGVVLKAPAIFLMAMFCNFWKGDSWVFCWFHQTSAPKSATVVIQLWYSCLMADWLRPRSVLPRRDRAIKTLMAEVVLVRMWCFHVSFLSSQNPSHL